MSPADHQRLSAIAHATSTMWGPISDAALDEIVERVADAGIGRAARVIDLGCGPAELLRRVVSRTGASGLGVDASPHALDEARRRLAGRPEADRTELGARRHRRGVGRLREAYRGAMRSELERSPTHALAPLLRERSGPGWAQYERLHRMLDFVVVMGLK